MLVTISGHPMDCHEPVDKLELVTEGFVSSSEYEEVGVAGISSDSGDGMVFCSEVGDWGGVRGLAHVLESGIGRGTIEEDSWLIDSRVKCRQEAILLLNSWRRIRFSGLTQKMLLIISLSSLVMGSIESKKSGSCRYALKVSSLTLACFQGFRPAVKLISMTPSDHTSLGDDL